MRSSCNPYYSQSKIISIHEKKQNQPVTFNEHGYFYPWNLNLSNEKVSAFKVSKLKNTTVNESAILNYTHAIVSSSDADFLIAADALGNLHLAKQIEGNSETSVCTFSSVHDGLPLQDIGLNCDSSQLLLSSLDCWIKKWKLKHVNEQLKLEFQYKFRLNSNLSVKNIKWSSDDASYLICIGTAGSIYHAVCHKTGLHSQNRFAHCHTWKLPT